VVARARDIRDSDAQIRDIRAELEDPAVAYPDYYVQPFHAYAEGSLCWLAAFEVEAATYSMALRTFPGAGLSPAQAQRRLRDGIHGALRVRAPGSTVGARGPTRAPQPSQRGAHPRSARAGLSATARGARRGGRAGRRLQRGREQPLPGG